MTMTNKEEYQKFRENILRNIRSGANIHSINSCLGRIASSIKNVEIWTKVDHPDKHKKILDTFKTYEEDMKELYNLL